MMGNRDFFRVDLDDRGLCNLSSYEDFKKGQVFMILICKVESTTVI